MIDQLFKTSQKEKVREVVNHFSDRKLFEINQSIKDLAKGIEKDVSIENFDEVKKHLRIELKILANVIREMVNAMRMPDTLKVQGMPEQLKKLNAVVDYMENMKKLHDEISSVTEALKSIEFSPTINVDAPEMPSIEIPEIKIPTIRVPKAEITVEPRINVESPEIDIKALLKALKPLNLLSDKAGKPITVRMSDGKKFVEALNQVQKAQERFMQYVPGRGLDEDEFKKQFTNLTQSLSVTSNRKAVAVPGTAVQLIVASTPCYRVDVSADLGNTNPVYVGGAGVVAASGSQEGLVIIPGNQPFTIMIDNVNKLYVDAQTAADAVVFNYYTR